MSILPLLFFFALGFLPAQDRPQASASGFTLRLKAYDDRGELLEREQFLSYIGRADRKPEDEKIPLTLTSPQNLGSTVPWLKQSDSTLTLGWDKLARVQISLPWPVKESGFSTVWLDNGGRGYASGETVLLNEEIALTQYRLFQEACLRHNSGRPPAYKAGPQVRKLISHAGRTLTEARAKPAGPERAAAFDRLLRQTAAAWEKMLVEHGRQIAGHSKNKNELRFGLTLDESLLDRLDHHREIIDMVKDSGTNWVRLVFRSNPSDFAYSRIASFNEYDGIVLRLRAAGLNVMGGVLDTAQWPASLTPGLYTQRAKNLVLHYRDQINCWELGSELNGDWLGGRRSPLPSGRVFDIYMAAASSIKGIDPAIEVAATLYWWDGTAPDERHSLFGWLRHYVPLGFGKHLDIVSVSLQPEDNPAGIGLERIFQGVRDALPEKKIILGSFGYVEGRDLKGYWWFDPKDIDGARKDLLALYTPSSCALPGSICGGFWWQTLDQMLPADGRDAGLYHVYARALRLLGR